LSSFFQFTEHGHIFVQVRLAEVSNIASDANVDECPNGWLDEVEVKHSGTIFNTLSGLEAADDRNSWENFKIMLSGGKCLSVVPEKGIPYEKESGNVTVMVTVEDTGIGIPLHAQDRVFAPFMQADSSTSRNYGGTGIGLSISKCLVELMDGQISFISQPNIGSTFTFTAVLQECKKSAVGDMNRPVSEALPTCFQGMRVVLVDGRPVRGSVTTYHLQRLGITVEVTNNIKMGFSALVGKNGCSVSG